MRAEAGKGTMMVQEKTHVIIPVGKAVRSVSVRGQSVKGKKGKKGRKSTLRTIWMSSVVLTKNKVEAD